MNEREQQLAKEGIEKAIRNGAVKTAKKINRERGRPKLAKVETKFVEPFFWGSVELCPKTLKEVLADPARRHWVADQIEHVLAKDNFAERFGDGGGLNEQIERTRRWMEWRIEPPEYLLAEAWRDGNELRASLIAQWFLLRKKHSQKELLRFVENSPVELIDETEQGPYYLPNPPTQHREVTRSAMVLALLACGPQGGRLNSQSGSTKICRKLAYFFTQAWQPERRTEKALKSLEDDLRKILDSFGAKSLTQVIYNEKA